VYPIFVSTKVIIIGSKKYPIDPINLLPVVGSAILNKFFILYLQKNLAKKKKI
jgi:hypothetical protein